MTDQVSSKRATVRWPAFVSARAAFFAVFIGGLALCTQGIGQAPTYGWLHPVSVIGSVLGSLALLLGLLELFRWRVGPIRSDRAALLALVGIIAVKAVVAQFYAL